MVDTTLPTISDFIPEIVCLGVDCLVCGILYSAYFFTNRAITSVSSAAIFDLEKKPHDAELFRNEIHTHPRATLNADGETCIPYAVIRGNVQPVSNSLELTTGSIDGEANTALQNLQGVIRQFAIIEHKKTMSRTGFWYDSERIIHEYANHVPFCLVPQGCLNTKSIFGNKLLDSNCRKVEVLDWSDASILDLDVTRDSFEASPNSLSDNVWGWIVGDRPKGIQTTEKMLLNSTTLTAVGEIAISTDTGNIKIQAPSSGQNYYLVRDTAKGLVKNLGENSRILRNTLIFFGGIGTIILSIGAYRYLKRFRLYKESQRLRTELEEIVQARQNRSRNLHNESSTIQRTTSNSNIHNQDQSSSETVNISVDEPETDSLGVSAQTCIVCLSEQREVILLNCGHVCVCAGCAMEIMQTRALCPICRATIDRVAPAFIA